MKTKNRIWICPLIMLLVLIFVKGCKKDEGESICEAVVKSDLIILIDVYAVNFDVTNTGDKKLTRVTIPFVINFDNGTSKQGEAYMIIELAPGDTMNDVEALISPASQNPYNPRYIKFDGDIISHEFKTPSIQCSF